MLRLLKLWCRMPRPHPENARVSFGCELANHLFAVLDLDAQAGGSNARIMRTTRDWIGRNRNSLDDTFVLIQWSTWEREEWFHDDEWWQVNASGIDDLPRELQERYRQFVIDVDWRQCKRQAHQEIWQFHQELKDQGIRHLMFNGNSHFEELTPLDWGSSYISPYSAKNTYDSILRQQGYKTVKPDSWHFGQDAHCFWAEYLLQYIKRNQLLRPNEIPAD
jgi:hypothetical protein